MINLYKLVDPHNKETRYIGLTDSPKRRYYQYCIRSGCSNYRLHDWLVELHEVGLKPEMIIIERTYDSQYAHRRETQLIQMYCNEGYSLLNSISMPKIISNQLCGKIYLEHKTVKI